MPIDAGMAIVVWIGIVISAQAFQVGAAGARAGGGDGHPAGDRGLGRAHGEERGCARRGWATAGGPPLSEGVVDGFLGSDVWIQGAFALEQGFIFTAMILSAGTVMIVERRFRAAAGWFAIGAVLSGTGLMHAWRLTPQDAVMAMRPAWGFVAGYAFVAGLLLLAPYVTEPDQGGHG